jgi:plastocyanin
MRHALRPLRAALPLAVTGLMVTGLTACGGGGDDGGSPPPTEVVGTAPRDSVFMPGNSFSPFSLSVKVGQSVAWVFPRDAHNVIFPKGAGGQTVPPGAPADILPTTNRVVTRRFDAAGTFPYDCTLHAGMKGEVVVTR